MQNIHPKCSGDYLEDYGESGGGDFDEGEESYDGGQINANSSNIDPNKGTYQVYFNDIQSSILHYSCTYNFSANMDDCCSSPIQWHNYYHASEDAENVPIFIQSI